MKKPYTEPNVETVVFSAKDDILLNSDVDMDVSNLFESTGTLN